MCGGFGVLLNGYESKATKHAKVDQRIKVVTFGDSPAQHEILGMCRAQVVRRRHTTTIATEG